MELLLSAREQRVIADILYVCDEGESDPEVDLGDMLRAMMPLLGADKGAFCVPVRGAFVSAHENHDTDTFTRYPSELDPIARSVSLYNRHVELGVWTRNELWYPHNDVMRRSEYYNEFIVPRGCHDAIGISIALGGKPTVASLAQVLFHHDCARGRRFGAREHAVLRLLRPAIAGYIRRWQRALRYDSAIESASSVTDAPRGRAGSLTRREFQIAELVAAKGLSNKALAQHLGVSVHTVRHHVESVMSKLGATSRTQIAIRLHQG